MENKAKPCFGIGKAKNWKGCGKLSLYRDCGLCPKCRIEWLKSGDEEAQEYLLKRLIPKAKKKVSKDAIENKKADKVKQWNLNKKTFYQSPAWKYFSEYVKLSHTDENGLIRCVTSGRVFDMNRYEQRKNIHAGHYLKVFDSNGKTNYSTAFILTNCYPQSSQENTYGGGNQEKMKEYIIKTHGQKALDELIELSKRPLKLDKFTLDEIGKYWLGKLKELKK